MPIALLPCWICLLFAGWLVPKSQRADWRQEWIAEAWHRWGTLGSRGKWNAREALELYRMVSGCFQDAWCQFTIKEHPLRNEIQKPVFCAAVLTACIPLLAFTSHYFAVTRTILSPLPYQNGSRLALVNRTGRLQSIQRGIPASLAEFWRRDGKLTEGMAAYALAHEHAALIGGRPFDIISLQASANLFDVIGESTRQQEGAWLTYTFWQHELHSDPKMIGRYLHHGTFSLRIAGVLPRNFWLISPAIQVIELGSLPAAGQSMLLVRAKPEISAHQLEAELTHIAEQHDIPFMETAPHVLFLTDALRTPIWLFGGALLIAAVAVGLGHGSRLRRKDRAGSGLRFGNWRWWAFLVLKTAMALALVFVAGAEMFGGPVLLWFYAAACSVVLLAIIADQQARCRVCLRCLAFPIRVGCPGCLFLDWSGTELLCPDGHGMLYVPHHVSCWDEAERWVGLEI